MDNLQLLLITNAVLVAALGFFIRGYIKRQSDDHVKLEKQVRDNYDKLEKQLQHIIDILATKADGSDCKETHESLEKFLHKHASQGNAGEVVWL